jgi:hypothetical protein
MHQPSGCFGHISKPDRAGRKLTASDRPALPIRNFHACYVSIAALQRGPYSRPFIYISLEEIERERVSNLTNNNSGYTRAEVDSNVQPHKRLVILLAISNAVFIVLCAVFAFMAFNRPRFVATDNSPYVMFDRKTAQACWTGPPLENAPKDPFIDGLPKKPHDVRDDAAHEMAATANSAHLPFCKNLR